MQDLRVPALLSLMLLALLGACEHFVAPQQHHDTRTLRHEARCVAVQMTMMQIQLLLCKMPGRCR